MADVLLPLRAVAPDVIDEAALDAPDLTDETSDLASEMTPDELPVTAPAAALVAPDASDEMSEPCAATVALRPATKTAEKSILIDVFEMKMLVV